MYQSTDVENLKKINITKIYACSEEGFLKEVWVKNLSYIAAVLFGPIYYFYTKSKSLGFISLPFWWIGMVNPENSGMARLICIPILILLALRNKKSKVKIYSKNWGNKEIYYDSEGAIFFCEKNYFEKVKKLGLKVFLELQDVEIKKINAKRDHEAKVKAELEKKLAAEKAAKDLEEAIEKSIKESKSTMDVVGSYKIEPVPKKAKLFWKTKELDPTRMARIITSMDDIRLEINNEVYKGKDFVDINFTDKKRVKREAEKIQETEYRVVHGGISGLGSNNNLNLGLGKLTPITKTKFVTEKGEKDFYISIELPNDKFVELKFTTSYGSFFSHDFGFSLLGEFLQIEHTIKTDIDKIKKHIKQSDDVEERIKALGTYKRLYKEDLMKYVGDNKEALYRIINEVDKLIDEENKLR